MGNEAQESRAESHSCMWLNLNQVLTGGGIPSKGKAGHVNGTKTRRQESAWHLRRNHGG